MKQMNIGKRHTMDERTPIPINNSFDWYVESWPQTDSDGVTRDKLFIFPPAKWSVESFGPKQTGAVYKIEQRMIPTKKGLIKPRFEAYYEEEKEEFEDG